MLTIAADTLKHIGLDPEDESQDKPLVTVA